MKKQYPKTLKGLDGRKVRVYRNLTDKCFSVRCMETNRVIAHVHRITLRNVTFPVGESQRKEVIRSGHKNVHAFVEGFIDNEVSTQENTPITYNPRKRGYFYYKCNGREIKYSDFVTLNTRGVFAF